MAAKARELMVFVMVFAMLPEQPVGQFVPAWLLQLTEVVGANPQNRELASQSAYDLGYLKRRVAVEVDPVSPRQSTAYASASASELSLSPNPRRIVRKATTLSLSLCIGLCIIHRKQQHRCAFSELH